MFQYSSAARSSRTPSLSFPFAYWESGCTCIVRRPKLSSLFSSFLHPPKGQPSEQGNLDTQDSPVNPCMARPRADASSFVLIPPIVVRDGRNRALYTCRICCRCIESPLVTTCRICWLCSGHSVPSMNHH